MMVRMQGRWLVVAVALVVPAGCVRDALVACDNGFACPVGTVCAHLTAPDEQLCVDPAQVAACDGIAALGACEIAGVPGACRDDVCIPIACGNRRVDPGEACDDGNAIDGDGCSATCASAEVCGNGVLDPVRLAGDTAVANEQCDDDNAATYDGCSSTCGAEQLRWERLRLSMPDPYLMHAMAYDSARDRIVLFGGAFIGASPISVPRNDTWEWDGVGWVRVPTAITPTARSNHVLAYDPVRRRTMLFGGRASGTVFGDTWEWDGVAWTPRQPATSPPARAFAAATYDAVRGRVVMFGGRDFANAPLGDTWEWDGTTWVERVVATAPPAGADHSMAFDPRRGVVVMTSVAPRDTWEYDGSAWQPRGVVTPELRGTPLAFDGVGVVAFGGELLPGYSDETWRYDGQAWTRLTSAMAPAARGYAAMAPDPRRRRVLLVGGFAAQCPGACFNTFGDVHAWDGTQWTPIAVPAPTARAFASTAFDDERGCAIMFGGGDAFSATPAAAETWELCGDHWSRGGGPQPPGRVKGVMAYDRARRQVVLFGGRGVSGTLGDTWLWSGGTWTQVIGPGPSARSDAAMAFDPVSQRVILSGGFSASTYLDDTWAWNGTAWTLLAPAVKPSGRARHTMATDLGRARITLVGGEQAGTTVGEVWEWDGATWVPQAPTGVAPARGHTGLVWSAARRALVLFGGAAQTFSLFDDVWELSVARATQQFATGPGVRFGHAMWPTRDGSGVVVFGGGTATSTVDEIWRLRWQGDGPFELCTLDADADGDGLAGCADPDCWAACAPLCPPGVACDPASPRCGDGACNTARETCRMCPQDCGACAPACGDAFCDPGETAATCPGDCP